METNETSESGRSKHWLDRLAQWCAERALAVAIILASPFVAFAGWAGKVIDTWREFRKRFQPEDPYFLRTNGETLLSGHVKMELAVAMGTLITAEIAFEAFAWSSMWSYSLTGLLSWVISAAFVAMTFIITRAILTMDDSDEAKAKGALRSRLAMLMLIAVVLAIPSELRFFGSEIERYISAKEEVTVASLREQEKTKAIELSEKQKTTATASLSGAPADVVSRRTAERAAIVAQQSSDRAEITARLKAASADVIDEVGSGTHTSGRRGAGQTTAELRRQERVTREELTKYNEASRAQLAAFDAETETMRLGAEKVGVDAINDRDATLAATLAAIDAKPPEELSGKWKLSRGFLDQVGAWWHIMHLDENGEPATTWFTYNRFVGAIAALVMVLFGLAVVFYKEKLVTKPTKRYFSQEEQAHAGNPDAINGAIGDAKTGDVDAMKIVRSLALQGNEDAVKAVTGFALGGDEEAMKVLRMVAGGNEGALATLRKLGYNGDIEVAGWDPNVRALYGLAYAAQRDLHAALVEFRSAFRAQCQARVGTPSIRHTRAELTEFAEQAWRETVEPKMHALAAVESRVYMEGVKVLSWQPAFSERDPRTDKARLWQLRDAELSEQFGWEDPEFSALASRGPTARA